MKTNSKYNSTHRDPPHFHPDSVFLDEADVKKMEDYVEHCCHRRPSSLPSTDNDGFESGMRVPTLVLNGCNKSFTSADEKRLKTTLQFFIDTGLMALLCCHDCPLWIVNMTSPGERQHYALALIQLLFKHLPRTWQVGILYDIGCQLHRSVEKWGFLAEYKDRITFGISVFHAYGHQWPCQIIYHPRKCEGFGLTDGEGCERFWSSLKKLIPGLRVSGVCVSYTLHLCSVADSDCKYHQRIFTVDNQVLFLNAKSLENFGHWLFRRWFHLHERKQETEARLDDIPIRPSILRVEWSSQVQDQTKLVPRRYHPASLLNLTVNKVSRSITNAGAAHS